MNKITWLCIFSCVVGLSATSRADINFKERKDIDESRNTDLKLNLEKLLKKFRKHKQFSSKTKCSRGCQYNGKYIPEGTTANISACELCQCNGGQVVCAMRECAPIPSGCKAIPVKGQCCPKIECSEGCEYNGQLIQEGSEVKISPCEFCRCDSGEVSCVVLDCARPPDGCKPIYIEDQCCPSYNCTGGCEYNGQFIEEGSQVNITPCEFCNCDGGQVFCAIMDCPPIPSGCKAIPVEGQCCPKIECSGGCEYNGQLIQEGSEVNITPCEFCRCDGGEVSCAVLDCARPPDGCKPIYIEGQCCPSYNCTGGCEHNGQFIQEGSQVNITPCEFCRCDGGQVACAIIDCAPIPSGCKAIPVKGQCCPKIECSGGCEYNGQFIQEGSEVTITPCEICRCDGGKVSCAVADCAQAPANCKPIPVEGQCCPRYDCSTPL